MSQELKTFSELIDEQFELEDIKIEPADFWDLVLLKIVGEI
jgi:hypothetical protein